MTLPASIIHRDDHGKIHSWNCAGIEHQDFGYKFNSDKCNCFSLHPTPTGRSYRDDLGAASQQRRHTKDCATEKFQGKCDCEPLKEAYAAAEPTHEAYTHGRLTPPGSTKPTNPKDRAATSRLDLSLFPDTAVAYGALAMTEGDCKYGGYNYRPGGVMASVYVAALRRHLAKWYNGEDADLTTGVPHLASVVACAAVLIDAIECGVLNDDRPPKCDVAGLLSRAEGTVKDLQKLFPAGPRRYTEKEHG